MKKVKIRVLTGFPKDVQAPLRIVDHLLPYQDNDVELDVGHNMMGPITCNNEIEHALAVAGMTQAALDAENQGVDAIVIESMGDTGLIPCREAVNIPVVGFADTSVRIAQMLGRKFGLVTVGVWQGYALERLLQSYGLLQQYIGFEALGVQPFFTDITEEELQPKLLRAIIKLIERNCDTVILAGSYFIGKSKQLNDALAECGYPDIVIVDPFPLAIRFARLLVACNLLQSKRIYANPVHDTPVIGYPSILTTPRKNKHIGDY